MKFVNILFVLLIEKRTNTPFFLEVKKKRNWLSSGLVQNERFGSFQIIQSSI
jgi:hypothetical protein